MTHVEGENYIPHGTLSVGVRLRDRLTVPAIGPLSVTSHGTVPTLIGLVVTTAYAFRPATRSSLSVPLLVVGSASRFAGDSWLIGEHAHRPVLGQTLSLTSVVGRLPGLAQNLLDVGWYGYTSKSVVPERVSTAPGFVGPTFLSKPGVAVAVVPLVTSTDESSDPGWTDPISSAATREGLTGGIRGALRTAGGWIYARDAMCTNRSPLSLRHRWHSGGF